MERYMIVLKSYKRMPQELENALRKNVYPIAVRKHEIIQPAGTLSDQLYFVEKGLLQLYCLRDEEQVTLRFKKEDQFIVSLKELFPDPKKHKKGIQALEDGILWCFPGSLVTELKGNFPQFLDQFGTIIQNDWISIEEGAFCADLVGDPANYDRLRQTYPELLDRVPIPYLASYTGIPEKIFRHLHSSKIKLNLSTTRRRER